MRRRAFIGSVLATSIAGLAPGDVLAQRRRPGSRVVVVGAGAFGGWTALHLLRAGVRVTLIDAWGPGHSRASSGGETRVIRHAYGKRIYVELAKRSRELWLEASSAWGPPVFFETGALHMRQPGPWDEFFETAARLMTDAGVPFEQLGHDELARRYPQLDADGIESAIFEPGAGHLLARRACQEVVDVFRREGGDYRNAWVTPGAIVDGALTGIELGDGEFQIADQFVFACGPWLKGLFPDLLAGPLRVSRQEVFYFGVPPDERRYDMDRLPAWVDFGSNIWYGIPGGENRGFKLADDSHGPELDPSTTERRVTADGVERARSYVGRRFPGLANAPLIESRVCQYTNTPDGDFIADRHPGATNLWLLGGGSGHGFKHGPALGEMMAAQVLGERPVEPDFALSRPALAGSRS